MNEELQSLYNEYIAAGNSETPDQFLEARTLMGEQAFTDYVNTAIAEKKKVETTGEPIAPSQITDQLSGQPINQVDPRFDQTAMPEIIPTENSTASDSTLAQPLLASDSTTQNNIDVTLPEIIKPVVAPQQVTPVFNISTNNISNSNPIETLAGKQDDTLQSMPELPSLQPDQKTTDQFLNQYANKDYLNSNIPFVEKGVEYFSWATTPESVKESNDRLLDAERNGDVMLKADENGGILKDENGNYKYEILTDSYKDNFNKYITDLNNTAGTENIDSARFNQGNLGNTPEADESVQYLNDLQKEYGVLLTDEQVAQLTNEDSRKQLEINLETERRLKENPALDYNTVVAQVTNEKQGLSEQQKLAVGNNYVRGFFLETPSNYLEDEQDEYRFYQNYFSDPQNVSDFGDFMNDSGKAMFDTSWIKSNQTKKQQEGRKDLFENFLVWKGKNDRLDLELNRRAYENAKAKAELYQKENNLTAYNEELGKMNQYLDSYDKSIQSINNRNTEFQNIQNNYSKTLKSQQEKAEFQLKVQQGDKLANVENVVGNVILGAETSVQNAVTGLLRIASIPVGEGNFSDAIDILSKPLSIGNVDIARISDKVINYKSGNDNYKEVNGILYKVNSDGSLQRPDPRINTSSLEKVSEDTEYNVSGLAFVTSKMIADIFISQKTGGAIGGGISELSTAISNSKKIASVFGEGSQLAKAAASYARMAQNPTAVMVNGWTVQMYNDNYLAAENGGIKDPINKHLYAFTTSYILSQIQRINPDTNFLKTINSEQQAIVSSLLEGNTQKAILGIQSLAKKAAVNTSKEVVEENVQQATQDIINIGVNAVADKKLQVSDVQDYKDVFIGTVVPSLIASGLGGRVNQVEVGGRTLDLTNLTRNELVTELARTEQGINLLTDFRDKAFFDSQKAEADNIIAEVKERQKYINKIPDAEKYSTETINRVIPLLQEIDQKKKQLNTTEDTFKPRVEADVNNISTEVNNLLDSDNAQQVTTQPTQEPQTVQEQASTTTGQPQQIETPTMSQTNIDRQGNLSGNIFTDNEGKKYTLEQFGQNIDNSIMVLAKDGEKVIGSAVFTKKSDGSISSEATNIQSAYQRKGIGTAIYDYFTNQGYKLSPATDQTTQGKSFTDRYFNLNQNTINNETAQNIENVSQPVTTEPSIQPSDQTNVSTTDSQATQNQDTQVAQTVQIDETLFNDNVDLTPQQLEESNKQISNAISLFESLNQPSSTQANISQVEPIQPTLSANQTRITDNVIANSENITLPDGEQGIKITITDNSGNPIEDRNGDSEYEFASQEDVNAFIAQKSRGYNLSRNRPAVSNQQTEPSTPNVSEGQTVNFSQFGESKTGTISSINKGRILIKGADGKNYVGGSPLVSNLRDSSGNAIQLQQSAESFTPISQQEFDGLIEQLKKPFKNAFKNLNVTTNLEEARQRAAELGQDINGSEFTNANGNIYGFKLSDGTIYIDPNNLNANTPIHEFSHLWEQLLPNAWRRGMEIFKQTQTGKNLFNKLKSEENYNNLTDDQIWSEALNTHIGNYGEWKNNNPKGKMKQFADWIKNIFAKIGDYFGIKANPETSLKQFSDRVLGDLLGGKEIKGENIQVSIDPKYSWISRSDFNSDGTVKESVINEINNEREAIKNNAISEGNFMKAPNGNDTNLNEDQWLQVRTKRFKKWFGDWENNPSKASKALDANGEPKVLYHVGEKKLEFFNPSFKGRSDSNYGIFFSDSPEAVKDYEQTWAYDNKFIHTVYNKLNNPFIIDISQIRPGDRFTEHFDDYQNERYKNENIGWEGEMYLKILKYAKANGYDGAILKNTLDPSVLQDTHIVFNSNQIKSAIDNVGTFSLKENMIQFSIGSQQNNNVIPKSTFAKVVNATSSNGKEAGYNELSNSDWFQSLPADATNNITVDNFHNLMLDQAKLIQEQDAIKRDELLAKANEQKAKEIKDLKTNFRNKLQEVKTNYKNKIKSISNSNNRLSERIFLRKEASTAIKQLLNDKSLRDKITYAELNSLLAYADNIISTKNVNNVFDNFQNKLESIIDKAEKRGSKKDEWEEFKQNPEALEADPNANYNPITGRNVFVKFKEKWFANQGGLMKPFLGLKDSAKGSINWELRIAKNTIKELQKEQSKLKFNSDENNREIDKALRGDAEAYNNLPETIKPFIGKMRSQVDGLSNYLVDNNLVTPSQALSINENLGSYITRGYDYFDGKMGTLRTAERVSKKFYRLLFQKQGLLKSEFDSAKWADAVTVYQQNILNDIAADKKLGNNSKYGEDFHKQSEADIQAYARTEGESKLMEYIKSLEVEYHKQGSAQKADTSVLKQRKYVPEPIRKLLGEYEDPKISFALTISRMSQLAYQRKFMSQLKESGMGTLFFEENDPNKPGTHYVKIASDSNDSYAPLNGLYTTPEFKDVFLDVTEQNINDIGRLWMKATGFVKVGKTVLSPVTQMVNFFANPGFLINNGTILDVKQLGASMKVFIDDMKGSVSTNPIIQELIEENIIDQSIIFNELESDFGANIERDLVRNIRQNTVVKTGRDLLSIPFRAYKASDDFFKAFTYYAEANRYSKAIYGKKYKELQGEERLRIRGIASEATKNTMPNYDRRYKAADYARMKTGNLLGNFLSFQAESIRTKINSVQIALSDIKNPETRSVGIQRLAGIVTYNAIYGAITSYLGKTAGLGLVGVLGFFDNDDEDEKNKRFNRIVPEWARSTEKFVRRESDGTITFYTYGNSNPYGIWYKSANAYQNGSTNNPDGGLISIMDEFATPFFGTEMSAQWALNTFVKEENDWGADLVTWEDKARYSWEKLSPTAFKVYKDNMDENDKNNFDIYNALGVKKYNFDPTEQLGFKFRDWQTKINDIGRKKYTLEAQLNSGKINEKDAQARYKEYTEEQIKITDDFKKTYDAFVSWGAIPDNLLNKAERNFEFKYNSSKDFVDLLKMPTDISEKQTEEDKIKMIYETEEMRKK